MNGAGDALASGSGLVIGVILAGGKSRRMGQDKAALVVGGTPFGDTGARLIDIVAGALADAGVERILISGKKQSEVAGDANQLFECVEDKISDLGPVGGLASVVAALLREGPKNVGARLFVTPVDLPRFNAATVKRLLDVAGGGAWAGAWHAPGEGPDAVRFAEYELPIVFVLSDVLRREIEKLMDPSVPGYQRSLRGLISALKARGRVVDLLPSQEDERALFNANTPEDLKRMIT